MDELVQCLEQAGLLVGFAVAPARPRSRSEGSMPRATSRSALITVLRLIPEAPATVVLPPRPSISANAPATTRR